jgi:hydroxymethylpyrimidine/phosphomethylpyrimidine kinase
MNDKAGVSPQGAQGRVLIIAGSDPSGGAGLQADIKTVTALSGYAAAAITAITVQTTRGIAAIHALAPDLVRAQIEAVLSDVGADAIKIGMLANAPIAEAVAAALAESASDLPLVIDPVLRAKDGTALLDTPGVSVLKAALFPRAALITPNIPEAQALSGRAIRDEDDMKKAAEILHSLGPQAVLVKGGHLAGRTVSDVLLDRDGISIYRAEKIATRHTHGTGCTLSSAIATGLAQGLPLRETVSRAHAYVQEAIRSAPGFGAGHGPLNHAHTMRGTRRRALT